MSQIRQLIRSQQYEETDHDDDGASSSQVSTPIAASSNNNTSVWKKFDWGWYQSNMDIEISKAQTRIPIASECKKMWKRTRAEMYAGNEQEYEVSRSRRSIPRLSIIGNQATGL